MKSVLEKWTGKYLINHEIKETLKDVDFKDKEDFHLRLLARRERNVSNKH